MELLLFTSTCLALSLIGLAFDQPPARQIWLLRTGCWSLIFLLGAVAELELSNAPDPHSLVLFGLLVLVLHRQSSRALKVSLERLVAGICLDGAKRPGQAQTVSR
ncbi:MAG: hypothetical protein AB7S38_11535 [Vulcanimicrobiota bacterium]